MANNNVASMENLFQAMDIIISEKISNLGYDKTIKATIVNDEKADFGEYEVTTGSSNFTAFSKEGKYSKGQRVYIIVPQNDFNNEKLIVGRCLDDENGQYNYISSSESYVDITDNLIPYREVGLVANGPIQFYTFWSDDKASYKGYDRLLLRGNFRTWLQQLDILGGTYGLYLYVVSKEPIYRDQGEAGGSFERTYRYDLLSSDMYGDPYNFETYYLQEKVIDISELSEIISITLIAIQNNDFITSERLLAPSSDENGAWLPENIFIKEPYISLGYDISSVQSDELRLYSLDADTYNATYDEASRRKHMQLRWIHVRENNSLIVYDSTTASDKYPKNAIVHWYHKTNDRRVYDKLAGVSWEEIATDVFDYTYDPDITVAGESFKVIIEYPSRKWASDNVASFKPSSAITITLDGETDVEILEKAKRSYYDNSLQSFQEYKQKIIDYNNQYYVRTNTSYQNYFQAMEFLDAIEKAQMEVQVWKSAVLTFTNESYDPVKMAQDLINGLEIITDPAGFNGSYMIYNDTGLIQNPAEATKKRVFSAVYTSLITGETILDRAEKITWFFPIANTMIQKPQLNIEYTKYEVLREYSDFSNLEKEYLPHSNFCAIDRAIAEPGGKRGEEVEQQTNQIFRIKDYYNQNEKNNTVYCRVLKNGRSYWASTDLTFGTNGTNGTDATFLLKLKDVDNVYDIQALTLDPVANGLVVPQLFDYNGKDITESINSITYSWFMAGEGGLQLVSNMANRTARVNVINQDINKCKYYILRAETPWTIVEQATEEENGEEVVTENSKSRNVQLTAYLPIAVRATPAYEQVTGATQIVYDKDGTDPTYYKEAFKMYPQNIQISKWQGSSLEYEKSNPKEPKILSFYPAVSADGKLTPTGMYLTTGQGFAVNAFVGNNIVWTQPILIIQNRYSSPMLNAWDGKFFIDEENGTIMSTMVGAGIKNSDNTFSGVLMGDVGGVAESTNHSGLGLYGYYHGEQSFGANVDGTAFIGRAGRGRINFDGIKGIIQSGSFTDGKAGMQIDLDGKDSISASIKAFGPGGGFTVNTDNDSPLFTLKDSKTTLVHIDGKAEGEFYIQSTDYQPGKAGTKINLKTGEFNIYNASGNKYIQISGAGNPYLDIHNDKKSIFYAGDGGYYLESDDYSANGTVGVRIDLVNGSVTARIGNIGGWKITNTGLQGGNMYINSDGSMKGPDWEITATGQATFNNLMAYGSGRIGPFLITPSALTYSGGECTIVLGQSGISVNGDAFNVTPNGNVTIARDLTVGGKIHYRADTTQDGTYNVNGGYFGASGFTGIGSPGAWGFTPDGGQIGPWVFTKTELYDNDTNGINVKFTTSGTAVIKNKSGAGLDVALNIVRLYYNDNNYFYADANFAQIKGGGAFFTLKDSKINLYTTNSTEGITIDSGHISLNATEIQLKGKVIMDGEEAYTGRITYLDDSYIEVKGGLIVSGLCNT